MNINVNYPCIKVYYGGSLVRIGKTNLDGMIFNEKGQCRTIIWLVNEKGERWGGQG
jgi:hypothetical protein